MHSHVSAQHRHSVHCRIMPCYTTGAPGPSHTIAHTTPTFSCCILTCTFGLEFQSPAWPFLHTPCTEGWR